jgi:outer membrane protein assembly factor BamB
MSTITTALSRKRGFFRFWLPWVILALAGLAVTALWFWPGEQPARAERITGIWMSIPLTVLLLEAWVLFFSGWPQKVRLLVLLLPFVALGGLLAAVRDWSWSGDMVPHFTFRWQRAHDDVLEAHRRDQKEGGPWEPGDLSGNQPTDFPEYRGRQRDGVVPRAGLARDWKAQPPRLLWKQPVGGGYAGFAVAGNAAVTIEQRRDREAVVCYDTATGQEIWAYPYPAHFQERLGGPGPRATPTIRDGAVYSLGATGVLLCLDAATGEQRWTVNILEKRDNVPWGMSGSPLVYDQVVVVNPGAQGDGGKGRALEAYDRATSREVWHGGDAAAGYSSPMLATLGGVRQVLIFDAAGLGGYAAADGKELWRHPWPTYRGINVAQPLVLDGDRVFISSGYGVGCAVLRIRQEDGRWSVQELWKNQAMHCKFTSPVAFQGHLYGLDEGVLVCVEAETGKRTWRGERYGHGQLLLADDLLLILGEQGELALVEATPEAFRELGRIEALEGKTWNTLALAGGRVYLRNHEQMACYDLTGR